MISRPIIFKDFMVQAILAGTKTQTRRVVKPQHLKFFDQSAAEMLGQWDKRPFPHGQIGDRLWVRETWAHDAPSLEHCRASHEDIMGGNYHPYYRATEKYPETLYWRPSIHMPRWASRITLEITGVRVERLQDISEADATAEGAPWAACGSPQEGSHKAGFARLWESINGPDSWGVNPWVWVLKFKKLPNE